MINIIQLVQTRCSTLVEFYFKKITENPDKLNYSFLGINRKQYPKWEGWQIIQEYKDNGVNIKEITDERLDVLVKNFYFILYMEENNF